MPSVADATTITALSALDAVPTYSLSDTAANLAAAGAVGTNAVNITATDAATFAQGTTIVAFNPTLCYGYQSSRYRKPRQRHCECGTGHYDHGSFDHTNAGTVLANTIVDQRRWLQ